MYESLKWLIKKTKPDTSCGESIGGSDEPLVTPCLKCEFNLVLAPDAPYCQ